MSGRENIRQKEEEISMFENKTEAQARQEILDLVEERKQARKAKDFAKADALRYQIASMGYLVEETRQGTKVTKK